MHTIFEDNASSIGQTPLVRLNRVTGGQVYAKIESRNPSNSVKCRIGAGMIWAAEESGALTGEKAILEATSGNTGIALAFVAAARGYPLTLTMPESMSLERRKLLKALGATLVLTPADQGMKGAVNEANRLAAENPATYVQLKQFENPANPDIHVRTTAPEIEAALGGAPDIFVAGVGTGGTISGVARYFKSNGATMQAIAVEPEDSPIIGQALAGQELTPGPHKIQGIGAGFIPGNLDLSLLDGVERVSNDESMQMAHRLMREEGILAGISSGAAVVAAKRLAERPENADKRIVVIIASSAERYLSTPLFKDIFTAQELEP